MLSPDDYPEAPASIRGSVYMLGGQLPKSDVAGGRDSGASGKEACITAHMKGVPALVLDHDANDIMHDLDARQEYAQKVWAGRRCVGCSLGQGAHRVGGWLPPAGRLAGCASGGTGPRPGSLCCWHRQTAAHRAAAAPS